MDSITTACHAVRPAAADGHDYVPADHQFCMVLREVSKVRVQKWNDDLYMFGERKYVCPAGTVAYQSVAIRVTGFDFYCYISAVGMDHAVQTSIVSAINADKRSPHMPDPVARWDVVEMTSFVGFDYDAYLRSGRKHTRNPMIRLYLHNPTSIRAVQDKLAQPIRDCRNVLHNLTLYNADGEWGNMYVHTNQLQLQNTIQFAPGCLKAVVKRTTVCAEEYTLHYRPGQVQLVDRIDKPNLCATIRLRVVSAEARDTNTPRACIADPEHVAHDTLVSICTDVYWTGHMCPHIVRIRLWCQNGSVSDPLVPLSTGYDPSDEPAIMIARRCESAESMYTIWKAIMNRMDPDIWITLHDCGHDMLHLLFRDPTHNLSRMTNVTLPIRPAMNMKGVFWFGTPGRSMLQVADYMKKMQVKPSFDSFDLMSAYNHSKVYRGPPRPGLSDYNPNTSAFLSGHQNMLECGIETEVLRMIESGASIVADVAALSKVTTTELTRIISNGQQVRVYNRLQSDCHKAKRYINAEQLRKTVLILPSDQYNNFPDPPELPNVTLRYRTPHYNREWSTAVKASVVDPRTRHIHIKVAPDADTFPEAIPMPAIDAMKLPSNAKTTAAPVEDRRQTDLFGNHVMTDTNPRARKKTKVAAPKLKNYEGGLCHVPKAQFYDHPAERIAVLDFGSEYPSIIIAEGLCYCTLLWDERAMSDPTLTIKSVNVYENDSVAFVTHIRGVPVMAVLPETERELVAERKRVRKLQAEELVHIQQLLQELKLPEDTKEYAIRQLLRSCTEDTTASMLKRICQHFENFMNYEKQQLGSKVTQNAVFGFTGVVRGAKLGCLVLMATITSIGRWMNRTVKWYVIRYYQGAVVYGDTDSIFIMLPHIVIPLGPLDETEAELRIRANTIYFEHFHRIASEMGALFPSPHKVEFEAMAFPALLTKLKKNNVYQLWTNPRVPDKVKVSGMGFPKRDRCAFTKDVCGTALYMLFQGKAHLVNDYIVTSLTRLCMNEVPVEKLAISCSLQEDYKSDALVQLTVAKRIEQRTGVRPRPGSRISFVFMRGEEQQYKRGEQVSYIKQHKLPVDLQHYLDATTVLLELSMMHHSHYVDILGIHRRMSALISRHHASTAKSSVMSFFQKSATPVAVVPTKDQAELEVEKELTFEAWEFEDDEDATAADHVNYDEC